MKLFWQAVAITVAFAVILFGIVVIDALGQEYHGHDFKCSGVYTNARGLECCTANRDCFRVPSDVAWSAKIGDELPLPGPVKSMIVNAIHPSCDPQGHAWACTTGCLFKPSGF